MNCLPCCKHVPQITPQKDSLRPQSAGQSNQTTDEKCHKCVLYTFLGISSLGTLGMGTVTAIAFAKGSTATGALAAIMTGGSFLGNVGCCKYATAKGMDDIVKDLGYKTLDLEGVADNLKKENETLKTENEGLQKTVDQLNGIVAEAQNSVKILNVENKQLSDNVDALKKIREQLQNNSNRQADLNKTMLTALEEFGNKTPQFQQTVELCRTRINDLKKAEDLLNGILLKESTNADEIKKIQQDITAKNNELKATFNAFQDAFKVRNAQIATMEKLFSQLSQAEQAYLPLVDKLEAKLTELTRAINERTKELADLNALITAARQKLAAGKPPAYIGGSFASTAMK